MLGVLLENIALFEAAHKKYFPLSKATVEVTANSGRYEVKAGSAILFAFDLKQMPGCCGIAVLFDFYDRYGAFFQRFMPRIVGFIGQRGYSRVIATTLEEQKAVNLALREAGFEVKETFTNARSGNDVTVWMLDTYDRAAEALGDDNE